MRTLDQEIVAEAWNFASLAHQNQLVPGSKLPYLNHIGNVVLEVMTVLTVDKSISQPAVLILVAILHDIIEDTTVTYQAIADRFGVSVAEGVLALTKNDEIEIKKEKMLDSIHRILHQPREVSMVKLADRIVNLQPPPSNWNKEKIQEYRDEAVLIEQHLGQASLYLGARLKKKIKDYNKYIV